MRSEETFSRISASGRGYTGNFIPFMVKILFFLRSLRLCVYILFVRDGRDYTGKCFDRAEASGNKD
ncbi:MAG: hypothetical protein WC071_10240 [Victivallaceae bacterium]